MSSSSILRWINCTKAGAHSWQLTAGIALYVILPYSYCNILGQSGLRLRMGPLLDEGRPGHRERQDTGEGGEAPALGLQAFQPLDEILLQICCRRSYEGSRTQFMIVIGPLTRLPTLHIKPTSNLARPME